MMLPGGVAVNSVQSETESWTGAQRAFAVKSFYKNDDSYVAAWREFRKKFGIHRNSKVPSAHAIKTWVNNFEETGSTVKKKGGSVKTVRNPHRTLTLWEHRSNKVLAGRLRIIPRNWDTTQELKLRIQEEFSGILVDVLRRAISSVHNRLAECE